MNKEDYFKYYIQGSDHYLIPKDVFDELFEEMESWKEDTQKLQQENKELKKQLEYLRSGEYYNQLRFENEMLQQVVDTNGVPSEVYDYIDCTHRNTELLEENQELKKQVESKYEKVGTLTGELLYEENTKLINQQKEFISYLESEIYSIEPKGTGINYNCEYDSEEDYINAMEEQSKLNVFKEILSKYRSIIGGKE